MNGEEENDFNNAEDSSDEEKMETNSVDEDSDKDSEEEAEEHAKLERQVVELRKIVSKNPNAYDTHLELIQCLKKLGDLFQLRNAREEMSTVFPLSEELWLDWLRDEIKLVSNDDEKAKIVSLFSRATQDYLSIDIWLEYGQFMLSDVGSVEGLDKARQVFESAVTNGGLHIAKGAILWESYRELELAIYSSLPRGGAAELSPDQKELLTAQASRITTLFRRQLTVPLLNMNNTWEEFTEWLVLTGEEKDQAVEQAYQKASKMLQERLPFEEALMGITEGSADEKYQTYRSYLDFELDQKDPSRIQCLYERALTDVCLVPTLWREYYQYINRTLKNDKLAFPVHLRAVRNCPWSGQLWADYLLSCERYGKSTEIVGLVEKALTAGLATGADCRTVWLAFLDYTVRKFPLENPSEEQKEELRSAFQRAIDFLKEGYAYEGDPECELLRYWARIEIGKLKDLEKARELWKDVLTQASVHSSSAIWLQAINFERAFGDAKHAHRLFQRAIQAKTDWPEGIAAAFLQFEREEGDLESFESASLKCETKLAQVAAERQKEAAEDESVTTKPKVAKTKGKNKATEEKNQPQAKKRKVEEVDNKDSKEGNKDNKTTAVSVARKEAPPPDPSRESRTVFISNLDFSVAEDRLRSIFESSGQVTDVRLVSDYKGRSKGFGYVEFSDAKEATAALKRDRELLDGRPIFISPCTSDPNFKQNMFKYQTRLEKNKLFVKGLNFDTTKETLEKFFATFGELKDVRVVTFRNGRSKGLAYVEFKDETSASIAVMKTDGAELEGKIINVAISDPPQRKDTSLSLIPSLGGGAKPVGSRGKSKTQVSFLPRAVQMPTTAKPSSSDAGPKSNADFRSMLLGSK